jgi:hypothetical protein
MICKICGHPAQKTFEAILLRKHAVSYYLCTRCGFLHTEEPYWLEEAYSNSIALSDTGIMMRNLFSAKIASLLIYFGFNRNAKYVDIAGGYGILTRLMRDIGFDFYWHDPYSTNLVARGFDFIPQDNIEMVTAFEAFEHFADPLNEMEKMVTISPNIFFSTVLLPEPVPKPDDWSYYVLEHGQHISFFTLQALEVIAKRFGLNLLSNGVNLHLFTEKKVNPLFFKLLLKSHRVGLAAFVRRQMTSRTENDMKLLMERVEAS